MAKKAIALPPRKANTDSVADSRAGDLFHYRWAARRCLGMITPGSEILRLQIEGSEENSTSGELAIDVSEYRRGKDGKEDASYFQLKHSNKRKSQEIQIGELKRTLTQFGAKFVELQKTRKTRPQLGMVAFGIITNRKIESSLRQAFDNLAAGRCVARAIESKIEGAVGLSGKPLREFLAVLEFADRELDFKNQKTELQKDLSRYLSAPADDALINNFIALISEKVTDTDRTITREEVLQRLGTGSIRDFYPAPAKFEDISGFIQREQHPTLLAAILKAKGPLILHAGGGVGKSVVSQQLVASLPEGSVGIVYDCFGAGKYRKKSEPRHRYRDALVQIANELSSRALCDPLLQKREDSDDGILRAFLARIKSAGELIKAKKPKAVLAIIIDAADNAEIAAEEAGETCFAAALLNETVPDGCRLIAVSRTERVKEYLDPTSSVAQLKLDEFSLSESLTHLRSHFSSATSEDGLEFHRLTGGNPRVQANALEVKGATLREVLHSFGPSGISVNDQIAAQLATAVAKTREAFPKGFADQVDQVCYGLAILPPFVPLDVLATAAGVTPAAVKSFVSDLGRPLWVLDDSVQFRDEPTETWFRQTYLADPAKVGQYLERLVPLATQWPYVAEALPQLYLKAGKYDELIRLALSEDYLPENSPMDRRNLLVYRLQFAFRAALRQKRFADATRLALRAGEEMAGNERQLSLLQENVDLIAPLLARERVEEIARRRLLNGAWLGSENVYSAALLSTVNAFKGEARSYLRSSANWLNLYLKERRKNPAKFQHEEKLADADILEMAYAYFNLFGAEALVDFAFFWGEETLFKLSMGITRRLIDAGDFASVEAIAKAGRERPEFIVGVSEELSSVGRFLPAKALERSLNRLSRKNTRLPRPDSYVYDRPLLPAIMSFAEACANRKLTKEKILSVIRYYVPERAERGVAYEPQMKRDRDTFLRARSLEAILKKEKETALAKLVPVHLLNPGKDYEKISETKDFEAVVGQLLPWYQIRSRILYGESLDLPTEVKKAKDASQKAKGTSYKQIDTVPRTISHVRFEILCLNKKAVPQDIADYRKDSATQENRPLLRARIHTLRAAHRLGHLASIRQELETEIEQEILSDIKSPDEGPERISGDYVALARAVLISSPDDAKEFFNRAIEVGSKFGDEAVQRWEAVVSLAERAADGGHVSAKLAYRFTRCMDAVGETAREKHFERHVCAVIAQRLHPGAGFAALSRWRDRNVGWFGRILRSLANESIKTKSLPPRALWALTAFQEFAQIHEFAATCLETETDPAIRQEILDHAVLMLRFDRPSNVDLRTWKALEETARKNSLVNTDLSETVEFYSKAEDAKKSKSQVHTGRAREREVINWKAIFAGLDLTNTTGISEAFKRFEEKKSPIDVKGFWERAFAKIDGRDAIKFLKAVVDAESLDQYSLYPALSKIPTEWRSRVSIKRVIPEIAKSFAKRFSVNVVSPWARDQLIRETQDIADVADNLRDGLIEGLAQYPNQIDTRSFFCFPSIVAAELTPAEATALLEEALGRFEEHIGPETGDGDWHERFTPPTDSVEAFTGFIWAALGSPEASTRWQAMHCVRKLALMRCSGELTALVAWMDRDSALAYCGKDYPFYTLHARLYLLMALARISLDSPAAVRPFASAFKKYAVEDIPHALIQRYAAQTAIRIELAFPGTYTPEDIALFRAACASQLLPKASSGYEEKETTPWHAKGEVDRSNRVYFGFDQQEYWFQPLGRVFGVPGQEIEDLAQEFAIRTLKVPLDGKHIMDARKLTEGTDHSHGSYPRVDTYKFYAAYHSLFAVGAQLLQNMPVIQNDHGIYEGWEDYIKGHLPARPDGKWLADRRDLPPLERRAWVHDHRTEDWKRGIVPADFLNALIRPGNGEKWLNIFGRWNEAESDREESFRVSSALVNPETSQALLEALTDFERHNYRIPHYGEDEAEVQGAPFDLQGWIQSGSSDREIDSFDPYGGEIDYPPYKVGESFAQRLGLTADPEFREWHLAGKTDPDLVCKIWGEPGRRGRDDEYTKNGHQLRASLGFLRNLCATLNRDLLIEIQVGRNFSYRYRRNDDEKGYTQPQTKIFLLTKDGILSDTRERYPLG